LSKVPRWAFFLNLSPGRCRLAGKDRNRFVAATGNFAATGISFLLIRQVEPKPEGLVNRFLQFIFRDGLEIRGGSLRIEAPVVNQFLEVFLAMLHEIGSFLQMPADQKKGDSDVEISGNFPGTAFLRESQAQDQNPVTVETETIQQQAFLDFIGKVFRNRNR